MIALRPGLLALCISLASCASPVAHQNADLQKKEICCESFQQMEFQTLPLDKEMSVSVDASARAFQFNTGKSYFAAFRLPANAQTYDIQITTSANGVSVLDRSVFYPQFLLLDSDRNLRREERSPGVLYQSDFLRGDSWKTRLRLEPGDAYLVIYAEPARLKFGLSEPGAAGHAGVMGKTAYFDPGRPAALVPIAPTGKLAISCIERKAKLPVAAAPTKTTDLPPLEKPGMTVLTGSSQERSLTDWDGFQVTGVDDETIDYGSRDKFFKRPIPLQPGKHEVLVYFRTTRGSGMQGLLPDAYLNLEGDLKPGHRYHVNGYFENDVATAWIEDFEDGSRVSQEVSASIYWRHPSAL